MTNQYHRENKQHISTDNETLKPARKRCRNFITTWGGQRKEKETGAASAVADIQLQLYFKKYIC